MCKMYSPHENWDGTYIHFGGTFDRKKFEPIKNNFAMPKPYGGFWASRYTVDGFHWYDYNKKVHHKILKPEYSFEFTLKKGANIVEITSSKDLEALPKIPNEELPEKVQSTWVCLDFEKMLANGVDAIEVNGIFKERKLFFDLYTWDCDSILIMNPDIIERTELEEAKRICSLIPCYNYE